ncbi:cytochrome b-c1 complex subunit 10 [Diplodia corticola]|uniref:Cytochrome b-c1 complex subunit 10 n=1 Tax=Diplodia corticola TaxID=236234 RepID=A0A1J9RM05_9PEZI|nr:cytochrome b-c1 complex subunit 10 [Diplodia corticola]OJD29543.1 cytochrome b-c1 complex subunit 10 [Diplodia corticola]
MAPWTVRPGYKTYQSRFGPKYTTAPHFHGISLGRAVKLYVSFQPIHPPVHTSVSPFLLPGFVEYEKNSPREELVLLETKQKGGERRGEETIGPWSSGTTVAGFGAAAGVFAIFMFAEVPRVREDIMKKVPILGEYFDVKVAPEDNPF